MKVGVIFCPISEAVREHPELVQQLSGQRRAGRSDNFFAALNSAVFTDGSFVFIPKGVRCPMELSTYFRINARNTGPVRAHADHCRGGRLGQLPRGLHRAACATRTSCTPRWSSWSRWTTPRSSTARCRTGIRATRTAWAASTTSSPSAAPAAARGRKISWTQVETGSAITWKYPSCILQGEDSVGEFYSVAVTNNHQQADTGTKMIHIGKQHALDHRQPRASAPGSSDNTYRGLVRDAAEGVGRAELHPVRQPADRRPVRRAYRAVYREPQHDGARSSTRRPPARSPRTSCSTAGSAGCRRRMRSG